MSNQSIACATPKPRGPSISSICSGQVSPDLHRDFRWICGGAACADIQIPLTPLVKPHHPCRLKSTVLFADWYLGMAHTYQPQMVDPLKKTALFHVSLQYLMFEPSAFVSDHGVTLTERVISVRSGGDKQLTDTQTIRCSLRVLELQFWEVSKSETPSSAFGKYNTCVHNTYAYVHTHTHTCIHCIALHRYSCTHHMTSLKMDG